MFFLLQNASFVECRHFLSLPVLHQHSTRIFEVSAQFILGFVRTQRQSEWWRSINECCGSCYTTFELTRWNLSFFMLTRSEFRRYFTMLVKLYEVNLFERAFTKCFPLKFLMFARVVIVWRTSKQDHQQQQHKLLMFLLQKPFSICSHHIWVEASTTKEHISGRTKDSRNSKKERARERKVGENDNAAMSLLHEKNHVNYSFSVENNDVVDDYITTHSDAKMLSLFSTRNFMTA